MKQLLVCVSCGVLAAGCVANDSQRQLAHKEEALAQRILEKQLLKIGESYADWERVSDQANWAPELCTYVPPAGPQSSESTDESTHGQKLYFLYARHPAEYTYINVDWATDSRAATGHAQPDGQALVKQSWMPREVSETVGTLDESAAHDSHRSLTYSKRDGKYWAVDQQRELFVMLKTDLPIPTDNGWVYALLSPDGQQVLRSGLIEDCMKCHAEAPFDRLFGLPHSRARNK
jgi:hypothetical protein